MHTSLLLTAQDYSFVHYPFGPELVALKANVLYQDHSNRIWVGTNKGLLSFDGMQFHSVAISRDVSDTYSVTAIYADQQESFWLGTEDGRFLHGAPGNFELCISPPCAPIRAFARSKSGMIWAATYGNGLLAVCDSLKISMQTGELPSDDLYAALEDVEGNIWLASDGGVSIFHPQTSRNDRSMIHLGAREGLTDNIVMSMMKTADGLVWAGAFERGFCSITASGKITYPFPDWSFGAILAMTSVDDKEIWISTERNGLLRFDRSSRRLARVDLPGNATPVIKDMFSDNEGNLWLLDVYRGLYRTNRRFEGYLTALEGIQALLFDQNGQLFAGHPEGLYLLWPGEGREPERVLSKVNVLSLYEDAHRNLWVGTFGQGLYCRPRGLTQWYHYTRDNGLTDESILSITGLNDMIWLATLGGVTRIQVKNAVHPDLLETTNYNLADGLGTNFIYTALADSKGRIWFGTDGKGLSVLQNGQIRNFQKADSIPLHAVYSITEAINGDICFVTDRAGIFRFDGTEFRRIEIPLSLEDKEINNIMVDPLGNILLAHTSGVDMITPGHDMVMYRVSAPNLLSPNLNAHCSDSSGSIWIAGQQKILRYNALSSAERNYPYNVLTSVSVFLEPMDFLKKHTFSFAENYLTFDFIGLWYTSPLNVTYRYKVVGIDPDWNETHERSVTYQHIPSGNYVFMLESSSSGQYTARNSISYAFTIKKPFYQTAVFLIGVVLLFLLVLYGALRLRERRMEKAASLRRRQIESQLQTLKAQINPHFLFNSFNTLVAVIEEDPHAAVEYVEHLSDFYRSILQYREKNVIPLREEIEIVKSYTYILRKRFGSALSVQLPDTCPDVWVVPLVLQILVENAVKHNVISERKPLLINVRISDAQTIVVENTLQEKQISEDSTGFGLQSIVSRYALLCDRPIEVRQTPELFYVTIPALQKDEVSDS